MGKLGKKSPPEKTRLGEEKPNQGKHTKHTKICNFWFNEEIKTDTSDKSTLGVTQREKIPALVTQQSWKTEKSNFLSIRSRGKR